MPLDLSGRFVHDDKVGIAPAIAESFEAFSSGKSAVLRYSAIAQHSRSSALSAWAGSFELKRMRGFPDLTKVIPPPPSEKAALIAEDIAAAGNTEVPAYLTLVKLGYVVECTVNANGDEEWVAKKGALQLIGDGSLQLLGLCAMRTERGVDWRPLDSEIDQFMAQFYPDTSSK